ncbi:hypothetical protein [Aquidulcibacter sp.]|uniref:hypothetical protein n=1 Tax=Aquidulcibacter sp. TaxID=2052990 RepID=UPI0028B1F6F8|nr:hypothetical protein [Aquidulcibacter sp.]
MQVLKGVLKELLVHHGGELCSHGIFCRLKVGLLADLTIRYNSTTKITFSDLRSVFSNCGHLTIELDADYKPVSAVFLLDLNDGNGQFLGSSNVSDKRGFEVRKVIIAEPGPEKYEFEHCARVYGGAAIDGRTAFSSLDGQIATQVSNRQTQPKLKALKTLRDLAPSTRALFYNSLFIGELLFGLCEERGFDALDVGSVLSFLEQPVRTRQFRVIHSEGHSPVVLVWAWLNDEVLKSGAKGPFMPRYQGDWCCGPELCIILSIGHPTKVAKAMLDLFKDSMPADISGCWVWEATTGPKFLMLKAIESTAGGLT